MNKIEGVIFDWAGTTVDYGCFAPLHVFLKVFEEKGVSITFKEAREPMGLLKIDHIRAITKMPRVRKEWITVHGNEPEEQDIQAMYSNFEKTLFASLADYTTPIPGVLNVVKQLRERNIKIGSTTGYTREMMDIVKKHAKENGYSPDFLATADDVKQGRPFPWMCYYNAMELGIYPMNRMMKIGDTTTDMKEGRNAGMWTVGVVLGSSTLGLSEEEVTQLEDSVLKEKMKAARLELLEAGAHYVIDSISELMGLIDLIENKKETLHHS
ncbi:phosphonoacetaldehyde hydrolase [Bacillus pakistanensis]|uniref:Phosphonoacetaldehyde hydrolase n=1 Tax=Rossellomorea pakistanensis TaxID=992288 RepID=A0ABS2NGN8_9BACI|nr:phosphonoacetaldehyde hydrolase [Bacillus pakistanensis]MBM7587004.1 phosphonoacetaldehyde hydrolase [Bacillus pakistanensis]